MKIDNWYIKRSHYTISTSSLFDTVYVIDCNKIILCPPKNEAEVQKLLDKAKNIRYSKLWQVLNEEKL